MDDTAFGQLPKLVKRVRLPSVAYSLTLYSYKRLKSTTSRWQNSCTSPHSSYPCLESIHKREANPARQVFEAIVYVLCTGFQWKAPPEELS